MHSHNLQKMPQNFRATTWSKVQPNEIVYIQSGDGKALGPHQIVDPQNRTLKNMKLGRTHTLQDEVLLYKQGPFVGVSLVNGVFAGIYADLPLEIAVTVMDDEADLLFTTTTHRPRPIDCMPSDYRRTLDCFVPHGWPELYGKWEIVAAIAKEPTEQIVKVNINDNILGVSALMTELVNAGKPFSVKPDNEGSVEFAVTQSVYLWMVQHLTDLIGGF